MDDQPLAAALDAADADGEAASGLLSLEHRDEHDTLGEGHAWP